MSYLSLYTIANQGLNAEQLRIDTVAHNIANQYSCTIPMVLPFTQNESSQQHNLLIN